MDELERVLRLLDALQDLMDGDAARFGEGRDPALVRAVIDTWEAVDSQSAVFLAAVRAARGLAAN